MRTTTDNKIIQEFQSKKFLFLDQILFSQKKQATGGNREKDSTQKTLLWRVEEKHQKWNA